MPPDDPALPFSDAELDAYASTGQTAARLVAGFRRLRNESSELKHAAELLLASCPRPEDTEAREMRDRAVAVLSGRAKTIEAPWIERAADAMIGLGWVPAENRDWVVSLLHRHRNGTA